MASKAGVLVLNSGSSTIKYAMYNLGQSASCIFQGVVDGIGSSNTFINHKNLKGGEDTRLQDVQVSDHKEGLKKVLDLLHGDEGGQISINAVGHRVVHGGETLTQPSLISAEVKREIERAVPLAPLHNPPALQGITVAEELFHCPQVAVFDTAFHSTIPPHAYMYALPYNLYEEIGIRRYGAHGTSYRFLLDGASKMLNKPKDEVNAIFFHLGAGMSMAAVKHGKCIDTSMGVTPLEGLVMATRCGDIDPAVAGILATEKGMTSAQIDNMFNKQSGLYGLCGDKDMRALVKAADSGSARHELALKVFVHRIRKYLGAYLVHLDGQVDALIFSAGIGASSGKVRGLVCAGLESLGIELDPEKNKEGKIGAVSIHKESSKIKVLVIPTDEELSIAQQTWEVVKGLENKG